MQSQEVKVIDVQQLRIGLYIYLDLGWTEHPFPLNRFKIQTDTQLAQLRRLGLRQIKYLPAKSDVEPLPVAAEKTVVNQRDIEPASQKVIDAKRLRQELLDAQHASLELCEQQFARAAHTCKKVMLNARLEPSESAQAARQLISGVVKEIAGTHEVAIRLLSEKSGEESAVHSLNVTILSALLGNAMGLSSKELQSLGIGALLHDLGKTELNVRFRQRDQLNAAMDIRTYQSHVEQGILLAERMQLDAPSLAIIAQHHESMDGSGFPGQLQGEQISLLARMVAITNVYDNLCNASNPSQAVTPHDALAMMYAKRRHQFDLQMLTTFIKMMGVYPAGSVVQLSDERFALVTSVNANRPNKPQVLIHDEAVPVESAMLVNLDEVHELSIVRSLKPTQLPRAVYDYLSPRLRMCYFFERIREAKVSDE